MPTINQLTMPVHLPADILREIFHHLALGAHIEEQTDPWNSFEHITSITLVCKEWRTVAIETPSLWTRISTSDLLYSYVIRTYCIRSRRMPLTILMRFGEDGYVWGRDTSSEATEVVQDYSSRIREWFIAADDSLQPYPLNLRDTPNLQSLYLNFKYDEELNIFPEEFPSLQRLVLRRSAATHLQPSWCSNLKVLAITDSPRGITVMRLVTILEYCPQLESLSLIDLEGSMSYLPADQPKIARLPNLQHLRMSISNEQSEYILDRLILPDELTWDIDCKSSSSFQATRVIPQNLPVVKTSPDLVLELQGFNFKVTAGLDACFSSGLGASHGTKAYMERYFKDLCALIPSRLPTVSEVRFVFEYRVALPTTTTWKALIDKMGQLETLKFQIAPDVVHPYKVQSAILTVLKSFFEDIRNSRRFPEFRVLELDGFDFGVEEEKDLVGRIKEMIMDCGDMQKKLKLNIRHGQGLAEPIITQLREFVSMVVLD